MIGKIFRSVFGNKRDKGDNDSREAQGFSDNPDNSRQLFSTLKGMKTASRTRNAWRADFLRQHGQLGRKTDGKAGGGWGRGRPARDDSGKRKPAEKPPVFHNLPSSGAAGSRTSGSHAMLVQKVLRHFRGCGILPRPTKRRMRGRKAAPHLVTFRFSLVTAPEGRHGILPRPSGWRAGENGRRKSTRMSRMPPRVPGWLGDGRDVYIENQENRFADRNAHL